MLIFQMDSNELDNYNIDKITPEFLKFWNEYLTISIKNEYALLPPYINYICNTDIDNGGTCQVQIDDDDT